MKKEQRMSAKREIRYSLGLPNPDYRHKFYDMDEVVKVIVELAINNAVPIIGNRLIYETVTGFQRYSKKRWESLKPILIIISRKVEHIVDGEKYLISIYSPMFADEFNFYADEARNRPVAGFQVSKSK